MKGRRVHGYSKAIPSQKCTNDEGKGVEVKRARVSSPHTAMIIPCGVVYKKNERRDKCGEIKSGEVKNGVRNFQTYPLGTGIRLTFGFNIQQ